MVCSNCGVDNREGGKYCVECGSPLARPCPNCGMANPSRAKFCDECGTTLLPAGTPLPAGQLPAGQPPAGPQTAAAQSTPVAQPPIARPTPGIARVPAPTPAMAARPATERRLCSVLFCDLVGFTPLSETRDPEDVRELLSGYFELARAIVARYGGVVEKFIGDAVMAVWGAPIATEDDAERAVRAGIELVSAVAAYGSERAGVALEARVGIVTGEVATSDTADEGLVVGDRVNTAARIQSVAPPGCCYVDESTRSATYSAIAYVDAGEHALKGKAQPVHLYEASCVVATVAGAQGAGVLEAPFVGRDHDLRLLKDLFHASAERRTARLVLVSGVAGVGKSRLAWEFFKYLDGLAAEVLWHSGRCLAYGEGVSYWALSEMLRARLSIGEDDPLEVVAERIHAGLQRWIEDPADREFISHRIGPLLGLQRAQPLAREDLFAGWRLFFERLSEHLPVVLLIEDLQWADPGLLVFLDHLLEWSGDHAIFVLVLSRPDATQTAGLGHSRRSATTLALDRLRDEVMGELLDGLIAELPTPARSRIVERAEGIPLYAIETVRSLLDKDVLSRGDRGRLALVGELGELLIPPGLTALIASRLDALGSEERQVVKECSVLGGSFPRQAIEAVSEADPLVLPELLSSLVRKEVLTVRADKLSPEQGQYAFTQSLIRSVAYEMLTRSERKARHLKTAWHLKAAFPDEGAEVKEVIAAHFLDAYRAARDDPDADGLRALATDAYVQAAERAESVGSPNAAEAAFLRAVELSTDEAEQAALTERAGRMASLAGWFERAVAHYETAMAAHSEAGRVVDAARVMAWLGQALEWLGEGGTAIAGLRQALASLDETTAPPAVLAKLQATLGGILNLSAGRPDEAGELLESALTLAEHNELPDQFAGALNSKAILLHDVGRAEEARLLYEGAASIARRLGITRLELTAQANLADLCMTRDLPGAEEHGEMALALARRWGLRAGEALAADNLMEVLTMAGRLDEVERLGTELLRAGGAERRGADQINFRLANLEVLRGNLSVAREHLTVCRAWAESDDVQFRALYSAGEAALALAEGSSRLALEAAGGALATAMNGGLGLATDTVRLAFPVALESAIGIGDLKEADRLLQLLAVRPRGEVPPYLRAQLGRGRALAAVARGRDEDVEEGFIAAEATLRDLGYPYWTARVQLDRAEWLARQGRTDEAVTLARESAATFLSIGAAQMGARAHALFEPRSAGGDETRARAD
ncbi:MAG TPA: AAA family ATPase [Acidimicrobiales bacterium]|nr:AAA family ATPase [Acidimicrobiales bacterium]